jgi:tetratricopeptide (TPR) repeat protein
MVFCRTLRALLVLACTLRCLSASAEEEPNPLQQSESCQRAGQLVVDSIDGTTTDSGYRSLLAQLRTSIDGFVAEHGETTETSLHCLDAFGGVLLRLGEYVRASEVYRRAAAIATQNFGPEDGGTQTLKGNLAVALYSTQLFDEAARLGEEILAQREQFAGTPNAHKLGITLINLALAESARGELTRARELAERALRTAEQSIPATDGRMGTLLHDYAIVLDRAGLRSAAQEYFEKALHIRFAMDDRASAIESLASLAASFSDVGRFEESDLRYREAYTLADRILPPLHPVRAEIARSWCRVLNVLGKNAESLERCDLALALLKTRGEQGGVEALRTEVNRGITLGLLGRKPEAIQTLRQAGDGLRESLGSNNPEVVEATRALGVTLVDAGLFDEGEELLARSFREQTELLGGAHPDVVLAEGEYGVVLAIQGKWREAESVLKDYASKTETMRRLYGRDERTSIGVFSRFASTRMFLAKLLVVEGRCEEAFDWMETSKARSMMDRIVERAAVGTANATIRERVSALEQARARLYVEHARAGGDGARQTEMDGRLRAINGEITALGRATLERPGWSTSPDTPAQRLMRKDVPSDTAIASFGLVDNEVLVVTYRKQIGFRCTSLGNWSGLNETVLATRVLQSSVGGLPGLMAGSASTPAQRLLKTGTRSFAVQPRAVPIPDGASVVTSGDSVLDSVGSDLMGWVVASVGDADRLIVSADGILRLLALDALTIKGRALIADYSISHVPSFMRFLPSGGRAHHSTAASRMIVFGDPIYEQLQSAASSADSFRTAAMIVRGADEAATGWAPLPASAREVRALTGLFKLVGGKTLFARGAASAANLRMLNESGALRKARYVVFSTHAVADLAAPELSSIVLSIPKGRPPREAYFTAAEVATLALDSEMVFFSACETGYGRVVSGEGVLGLSVGALVAGSRSTVHTLWSVVDAASADFTSRFFGAVRRGTSPPEALTATKRDFIKDPKRRAPAYWAPYVLVQLPD